MIKKAKGYTKNETVEEYAVDEESGMMVLKKKKISKKHIPPDVNAIKLLLSYAEGSDKNIFENLTDEELQSMRNELLKELEESEDTGE